MSGINLNLNLENIRLYEKSMKFIDIKKVDQIQVDKKDDTFQKYYSQLIYESEEGKVRKIVRR